MLRRALILIVLLLAAVLLGPYAGVHLLGTRPIETAVEQTDRMPERVEPRPAPAKKSERTSIKGAKGDSRGLSEIEELLK